METIYCILSFLVAIAGIITIIRNRQVAKETYKGINYKEYSNSNTDIWRWRQPEQSLALHIYDTPKESCLKIPYQNKMLAKIIAIITIILAFIIPILSFIEFSETIKNPIKFFLIYYSITFIISWPIIKMTNCLVQINLSSKQVSFIFQNALSLKSKVNYKKKAVLSFSGDYQSIFEMTTNQTSPDYKIIIQKGKGWIKDKKRILCTCNKSQGSWIIGGLIYWQKN